MNLALYRRYRPQSFEEISGQSATLQVLCNALNAQRLHHAYLFTGTRGVGKTTIARLLAKALNCVQGISAKPCGVCTHCQALSQGTFPDLIEIDAASRTKVEDTRELLDNVQYLPTQGRYKVYLIDEVHMLSGHSFNALLKTLEEPPAHVVFFLATTDPQKLPITVLSRCLQFHLSRLSIDQIVSDLQRILLKEGRSIELAALKWIAHKADGSLRDAITLMEQALAYAPGALTLDMLGPILGLLDPHMALSLFIRVLEGDPRLLMAELNALYLKGVDYSELLRQLLILIHQISIAQWVPESLDTALVDQESLLRLAAQTSAESLQLYYQMVLNGQRDLAYAPSPQLGFEMTLFRMMAFQPVRIAAQAQQQVVRSVLPVHSELIQTKDKQDSVETLVVREAAPARAPEKASTILSEAPATAMTEEHNSVMLQLSSESLVQTTPGRPEIPGMPEWHLIVAKLNISGLTRMLAESCIINQVSESQIHLILDPNKQHLDHPRHRERLQEALTAYWGRSMTLRISQQVLASETPAMHTARVATEQHQARLQKMAADPTVQAMMQTFDAALEPLSSQDVS